MSRLPIATGTLSWRKDCRPAGFAVREHEVEQERAGFRHHRIPDAELNKVSQQLQESEAG